MRFDLLGFYCGRNLRSLQKLHVDAICICHIVYISQTAQRTPRPKRGRSLGQLGNLLPKIELVFLYLLLGDVFLQYLSQMIYFVARNIFHFTGGEG